MSDSVPAPGREAASSSAVIPLGTQLMRKSLSRQLYETLEEAIIEGRLQPGTRLGEDAVAAAFGVSRSPAREAIVELERNGFAERVSTRDRRITVPTAAFITDCFDVWALLESERLYESSRQADDAALRAIDRLLQDMEALHSIGDHAALERLLPEFHASLQRECRNRQLQRVSADWHKYVRWFRQLYFRNSTDREPEATEEALSHHRQIVEAFRRRDREALLRVIRTHIAWQCERVLAGWRASPAPDIASSTRMLEFELRPATLAGAPSTPTQDFRR